MRTRISSYPGGQRLSGEMPGYGRYFNPDRCVRNVPEVRCRNPWQWLGSVQTPRDPRVLGEVTRRDQDAIWKKSHRAPHNTIAPFTSTGGIASERNLFPSSDTTGEVLVPAVLHAVFSAQMVSGKCHRPTKVFPRLHCSAVMHAVLLTNKNADASSHRSIESSQSD